MSPSSSRIWLPLLCMGALGGCGRLNFEGVQLEANASDASLGTGDPSAATDAPGSEPSGPTTDGVAGSTDSQSMASPTSADGDAGMSTSSAPNPTSPSSAPTDAGMMPPTPAPSGTGTPDASLTLDDPPQATIDSGATSEDDAGTGSTSTDTPPGSGDEPDAGSPADAGLEAGTGPTFPSNCDGAPSLAQWWFTSDLESWVFSSSAPVPYSLDWVATGGTPAATGLVQLNVTPGDELSLINLPMSETDYSGRVLSARVYIVAGTNVGFKLYAQSGPTFAWADGGRVYPPAGQWLCLSFELSTPSFANAAFDPTEIIEVGVDVTGDGDVTVLVDEVRL